MSSEKRSAEPSPIKDEPKSKKPPKTAPARSPIERAVVWGLIAVLLVIVTWEFTAHLGYKKALRGLTERVDQAEKGKSFPATELPVVVGGKAPASHKEIFDAEYGRCVEEIYRWNGPLRKRTVRVILTVGSDPDVMDFRTEGAAAAPNELPPADDAPSKR